MIIEELVGKKLTHFKYGEGEVIDVEIDYSNITSAKVVLKFENQVKKFLVSSLDGKFFIDVPEDLIDDLNEIKKLNEKNIDEQALSKTKNLDFCEEDEAGNKLQICDWEISKRFVTNFWWSFSKIPSPVVKDNKKVYISAKAACIDNGLPENGYSVIYEVCNGSAIRTTYEGHRWRLATTKDINSVIEQLKSHE